MQLLGFGFLSSLTLICGLICDFCLSGQRFAHWSASQLRNPASFRFHLAMNTLAFGYDLPTAGRSRDFHPLECALAGRTKQKEDAPRPLFISQSVLYCGSVCTTPRVQSTDTTVPSVSRRVALGAATITGLSNVRPTVAEWLSVLASSLITAAACRI